LLDLSRWSDKSTGTLIAYLFLFRRRTMSAPVTPSLNGRVKKTLAFQLDRLDTILDGLAEALNDAVADAVQKAVEPAAHQAVRMALAEATARQQPRPSSRSPFWGRAKAKIASWVTTVKSHLRSAGNQVQKYSTRVVSATALALQTGTATLRSRAMRVGMLLGAVSSCALCMFRKDARRVWWGAGIVICTMVLESTFGPWGTLLLGAGVASVMMLQGPAGQGLPGRRAMVYDG
jgi:hypothetical protein